MKKKIINSFILTNHHENFKLLLFFLGYNLLLKKSFNYLERLNVLCNLLVVQSKFKTAF